MIDDSLYRIISRYQPMTRYKDAFLDKKLQKQAKWEKRFINVFFSSRPVRREDKNIHYDLIMEGFNSEPGLTF